jgi:adenylate kinase
MKKIAVVIYGPPGSGKGTQANLLAESLGLIHFDTGRFVESVVHNPSRQKEKVIQRERKLFDGGKLMTPAFVLREVAKHTKQIARAGFGVVYSGSPRTMYEAKGLIPVLSKLYGKKNVFFIVLQVPEQTSSSRNRARLVCKTCRRPLLTAYAKEMKNCPVCGGKFYKRSVDNPKIMHIRLEEYRKRTEPIFTLARSKGFRFKEVDGRPAPAKVFEQIHGYLKKQGRG